VESFLVVSIAILEESVAILEESALIFVESAVLVESALASVLALLLQAAKARVKTPIDNTNKNFFICDFFFVN